MTITVQTMAVSINKSLFIEDSVIIVRVFIRFSKRQTISGKFTWNKKKQEKNIKMLLNPRLKYFYRNILLVMASIIRGLTGKT